MTISQTLQQKIGEAMKAHDEVRLSTLRLLSSAFNYERIAKQHELTEEEELDVVRKQAKQRKDSIEAYKKAGANDRAEKEWLELKILQEYLPPEMSQEDLTKLVDSVISETGANSVSDMGRVMSGVKAKAPGADGAIVAQMVRSKLSG